MDIAKKKHIYTIGAIKYGTWFHEILKDYNFKIQGFFFAQILALLSKTRAAPHSVVGVSLALISKLKAAGPQFQLGNFAVGQIEMFSPEESVTQSDGMISKIKDLEY